MKLTVMIKQDVEINNDQLGSAIMQYIINRWGELDEAGSDLYTDDVGRTYIDDDPNLLVSAVPAVASLVDAANIIRYGKPFRLTSHWDGSEEDESYPNYEEAA